MRCRWPGPLAFLLALTAWAVSAQAFDPVSAFQKGAWVGSIEAGYGEQSEIFNDPITGLEFFNAGVRLGLVPFGPTGSGLLHGALEIGLEAFYQQFVDPDDAFFAGLAAVGRYHFLTGGRLVPYLEVAAGAGATDLDVREQDSDGTFLLSAGAGVSYFLTDRTAIYAGYRLQHISNAGTDDPNRGINSHTGVLGLSIFFGR